MGIWELRKEDELWVKIGFDWVLMRVFGEPLKRIDGRVRVILTVVGFWWSCIWFLGEDLRSWVCRAPGSRRKGAARVFNMNRAREKQTARVFNTGRVCEACNFHLPHTGQQHGPCPLVSVARVPSTGHVREACRTYLPHTGRAEQHGPCSYFGLHGSQRLCTGRVSWLSTGRADWYGSRWFCTGQAWFCTGRAIFLLLR